MKFHGIEVAEGTVVKNLSAPVGSDFPADPNNGEIFYKTTDNNLYFYKNGSWAVITSVSSGYLELTGGTLTGDLRVDSSIGVNRAPRVSLDVGGDVIIQPTSASNATINLRHGSVSTNAGLKADSSGNLTIFTNDSTNSVTFSTSGVATFTNDIYVTTYKVWHQNNDGASSGLDADLLDGQEGSYYSNAANLTGTISSAVLGNSTLYVGTTAVALNRASANQNLTGISSVSFPGSTSGTASLAAPAIAGTTSFELPSASGTLIGTGDVGTVTNVMLVGSIANSKLLNSSITINGSSVSLGGSTTVSASTTNALTIGTGLSGTSFDGSSAVTIAIDSTVATLTGTQTLTNKTLEDATTYFADNSDSTKKLQFQLSGITTGTTRTLTVPDASGTIALLSDLGSAANDGILTLAVSGVGLSGSASFTANQAGNTTFTVTSNATSANTASTIVARDASGNFTAGTITASLTGNASTATTLQTARNINGVAFDGSSNITIAANTTNALTIGTGLSGTSFNGSSAVTIAIDSTVATLTGTQTLTNKTLTDSTTFIQDETDNTKKLQFQVSGITTGTTRTLTAPDVNGTIITTGDTGTVTNTMLAGSITNAKLLNSSVTVNGSTVALGDSTTVTANTTNALTIGTGLTGTSFNGSSAVTVAIDSTVATLTGTQTLTNKTLTDSSTFFQDENDASKKLQFQLSGITTATTRTLTVPDASGTIALTSNIPTVNDGSLTLAVSGVGLSGSASFTANQAGSSTFTVTSNATSANTASTIVARDASGNFTAGTITAALSGNASTATSLQNARNLWGQSFDGTANVTGSLTSVGNITGSGGVTLTATSGTLALAATGANVITASTNGSEKVRIDASGNMGIGETSAATKLHVKGAGGNAAAIRIESTTNTDGRLSVKNTLGQYSVGITGAATGDFTFYDDLNSQTAHLYHAGASGYHKFYTNNVEQLNIGTTSASFAGDLTVGGNLVVNGSTVTINSTIVSIDDPILTLGGDTAPTVDDNKDRGIEYRWHNGTSAKVGFFGYDDSTGKFTFIPDATNTSEVFSGTKGEVDAYLNWTNVTNTPTTLAGYGITDASSSTHTHTSIANGTSNVTIASSGGDITVARAGSTQATFGASTITLANNITVSNNSATLYLDSPSGNSQMQFLLASSLYGLVGVAASNGALMTGSLTGDMVARVNGNKFHVTTDNGSSAALTVNASGYVGIGTTGPTAKFQVSNNVSSLNTAYIGAGFNGSGKGLVVDASTRTSSDDTIAVFEAIDRTGATSLRSNVNGNVLIGTSSDNTTDKVQIVGNVNIGSGIIKLNSSVAMNTATLTTSTTTANQVIGVFSATVYRSVKCIVQAKSGSSYHVTEFMVLHDGTTTYNNEYGTVFTGSSLITLDSDISGGNVRLLVTPANAVTTINVSLTLINV